MVTFTAPRVVMYMGMGMKNIRQDSLRSSPACFFSEVLCPWFQQQHVPNQPHVLSLFACMQRSINPTMDVTKGFELLLESQPCQEA